MNASFRLLQGGLIVYYVMNSNHLTEMSRHARTNENASPTKPPALGDQVFGLVTAIADCHFTTLYRHQSHI